MLNMWDDRNQHGTVLQVSGTTRPRLASKTRLRFDRKSQHYLLLYPERGLELNPTAAEILLLCTGGYDAEQIVEHLRQRHGTPSRETIREDVIGFLQTLMDRGLLREA